MDKEPIIDDTYRRPPYQCPVCGEDRITGKIRPHGCLSYVCGWSQWGNGCICEGKKYEHLIVRAEIPEPQEP